VGRLPQSEVTQPAAQRTRGSHKEIPHFFLKVLISRNRLKVLPREKKWRNSFVAGYAGAKVNYLELPIVASIFTAGWIYWEGGGGS
jgi:hypothetical protein